VVLEGTRALVTGGATGLGRAIVHALHQAGARVIWTDQREPEHPAHRMPADAPSFVRQDVRERADWERVADKVRTRLGGLDVLVNNAGVSSRADLLDTSDDDWARIFRTNVWAPWTGIRVFIDDLAASGGCVVNIGSLYGETSPPGPPATPTSVAYQASKSALHTLTRTAAVELAPRGIRVNAVLPGVFVTPLLDDLPQATLRARISRAPQQRAGDPAELADAVCYLASPRASFVTGALLPVDGGALAT
jgi:NAD(P)-dependent dehydrogenase (short-subunit alcohol dehydrogenase family)